MFAASAASLTLGATALPVAAKAFGELHRTVLQSNGNNTLARQGESFDPAEGARERNSRQRAGGITGGTCSETEEPSYMDATPKKASAGDIRRSYETKKGSATSSKGILSDILAKVPRRTVGTESYKRASRPAPSRQGGYGNQSFTP